VNDDRPTVSVVIPVLNGARWLGDQLEALKRDSAQPFETVIADNGSTDDSVAIARSFDGEMTVIVADASNRRSHGFARNVGAKTATGEYLLFLDADDVIGPGYVSAMVSALDRAEFVAARMESDKLNEGWRRHGRALPQTNGLPGDTVPWAYGGTLGMWRSTFERVGGFAEDFAAEDVDFGIRAHKSGVLLTFVSDAVLHYRYPTTLRGFFRQGLSYGFSGTMVKARHGGTATMTRRATIRSFAGPIRCCAIGPTKGLRARGLFLLGRRLGTMRALRRLSHEAAGVVTHSPKGAYDAKAAS
jgi:glycosyltransferase involved in cell wall biosynthesis